MYYNLSICLIFGKTEIDMLQQLRHVYSNSFSVCAVRTYCVMKWQITFIGSYKNFVECTIFQFQSECNSDIFRDAMYAERPVEIASFSFNYVKSPSN